MGRSMAVLARVARRLNRGWPGLPALLFLTDGARTPDPVGVARRLPRGAGVIYRHFGAPDRLETALRLRAVCRRRGLTLLIGADAALARKLGAGLHLPERALRSRIPRVAGQLLTAAAHGQMGLARAKALGLDAALLSPVFPTRSASARPALGALRAGRLAREASLPVYALGGINARTAARLIGRGFAGIAAVDGLLG